MRYFLTKGAAEEVEVTKEEFIQAERRAGFRPKSGDGLATAGFSSSIGISGRVEYIWND